jgi:hypothetical protein
LGRLGSAKHAAEVTQMISARANSRTRARIRGDANRDTIPSDRVVTPPNVADNEAISGFVHDW